MIRPVTLDDAKAINDIYNGYVLNDTVTFDIEPYTLEEMRQCISNISAQSLYFVYEVEGKVVAYCYAHTWKERVAYQNTLETTIYVSPSFLRKGIGKFMMEELIEACRKKGYHALVACITSGNEASFKLHEKLGFKKVAEFEEVGCKFNKWLGVRYYEFLLSSTTASCSADSAK